MKRDYVPINAPELRVSQWIDAQGKPTAPLTMADFGDGFKVIYCFQHWCPGCHSHGFPTLKKLVQALSGHGFAFAAVQTVFEGAEVNTFERLRENRRDNRGCTVCGHEGHEFKAHYCNRCGHVLPEHIEH